jgi:membrane protein
VRKTYRLANKIILPGEKRLSVYDVGKYLTLEMTYLRIQERAAAVTFNFLMAMPPTLLFLFSLVPYLPLQNAEQIVLSAIRQITPNRRIYYSVSAVVKDFMHTRHRDILSIGILMTLLYSSNGMMGLMKTFDKSFSLYNKDITLYKRRGSIRRRWTAIKLTAMVLALCIVMLMVLVIQNKKLNHLLMKVFHHGWPVQVLSFLVLVFVIFIAISVIYRYGPSLTHRFRFFSAGAVFATLASVAGTAIFFFLVNHFLNYSKVYGPIGSLIAFMVWVWFNTLIILLGYELNVSILLGKLSRKNQEIVGGEPDEK